MHVCHASKDPDHGVLSSLAETSPHRCLALVANSVQGHAVSGEIALLLSQPPGVVREIWEQKVTNNRNDKGDGSLKDKQPLPAANSSNVT